MNAIYTQQSVRKNVATNLASLNIAHSLLAILFVGLVLTVSGIMIECNYQANLLNCLELGDHIPIRSLPYFKARRLLSTLLIPVTSPPAP